MVSSAIVGGLILAMIEGISLGMTRFSGQSMIQEQMAQMQQQRNEM